MTNKPMLSVEILPCPMCAGKVREPAARPIGHSDVCFVISCNCGLSFDGGQDMESAVRTWNRRATAATPHHGEPVAWLNIATGHVTTSAVVVMDWDDEKEQVQALYAEHPAPVADHPQCEECKGWGYHENHHEGGGTECGECGGSGNATVEVVMVMPDRMEVEPFTTIDRGSKNYKAGYNAALAEVARLNEVKP